MDNHQTIHDVGFDEAWEHDLIGENRRELEGANARLHAAGSEAEGVRMRMVAVVVRTWFTAVGSGQEMRTQQAAVETQRRSLVLLPMRHAVGDASLADVDRKSTRLTSSH